MPKKIIRLLLLALLAATVGACGGGATEPGDDGPIRVVATLGQITDVVERVGGNLVHVDGLMGPGVDPHLYVASEGDVELLQNAKVIFYNGLFLEAQMAEVLAQLGERKTVTAVGERVDPESLLSWAANSEHHDPHIWFDVTLWIQAVEAVRDTLSKYDPDHADTYQANAEAYIAELEELHAYVQEQAARVPAERRALVTAHDAFSYFGKAYGFEVRGLQGISTAAEAGAGDVQELSTFIAERRIPAVFIESSVPVRNVEALQAAVAAQGFDVEIGGELFSDAMGDPDTPEGTYIGMVRHNIDTIVAALLAE